MIAPSHESPATEPTLGSKSYPDVWPMLAKVVHKKFRMVAVNHIALISRIWNAFVHSIHESERSIDLA
jgi:hypothetical protein